MATSKDILKRLNEKLDQKNKVLGVYEDYYLGNHRLSFATSKFRETFGNLFSALAVNFCQLVVDAEKERLNVEGFRFGTKEDKADNEAWRIWQANRMDARANVAHSEALTKGEAFVLVYTNAVKPDTPLIRVQDARRVVVEYDDGEVDARTVAMKRWFSATDKREYATLYFPDRIEKYQSTNEVTSVAGVTTRGADYWKRRIVEDEDWPLLHSLEVVPMVPLLNNPMLDYTGRSELASVVPIQDAINKLVADMLVASEFVAFPQRWATGIEVPVDEQTGQPIEPFKAGAGRLWLADVVQGLDQPIEPKFGQFPQADLAPYTEAIAMLIQQLASITKTPAHYLLGGSGSFPSGETLKATETGLVAKTKSAMSDFSDGWEDVLRLAFRAIGDSRGNEEHVEVIWGDPESRVLSEVTDAMGKQVALLGIPQKVSWEKVGYSQIEIQRMEVMKAQEALEAPPAPPAPLSLIPGGAAAGSGNAAAVAQQPTPSGRAQARQG